MPLDTFMGRVGGTVARRHKHSEQYRTYQILSEDYAHYYYNLQTHGFEFQF